MGEARGKYGAEAKCMKGYDGETKERHQIQRPSHRRDRMDSINLTHDEYKGHNLVNRVLKLWTP